MLYVNGLAVGVIELKRSAVSIGDGIRQTHLEPVAGVQCLVLQHRANRLCGQRHARGCDTARSVRPRNTSCSGRRTRPTTAGYKLDKYLLKMCSKARLIELMRDFVLFDGGVKKLPRVHQYFGDKGRAGARPGLQGRDHLAHPGQRQKHHHGAAGQVDPGELPNARVLIVTDRDELDKQIERRLPRQRRSPSAGRKRRRSDGQLGQAKPRLLCSLVHKFGRKGVDNFDAFIEELRRRSPARP